MHLITLVASLAAHVVQSTAAILEVVVRIVVALFGKA